MQVSLGNLFASNYYTSESLDVSNKTMAKKINEKAQYVLTQNGFCEVKPKIDNWKIALSIAIPLIPLVYAIYAFIKMNKYIKLNDDETENEKKFKNLKININNCSEIISFFKNTVDFDNEQILLMKGIPLKGALDMMEINKYIPAKKFMNAIKNLDTNDANCFSKIQNLMNQIAASV